ncbi:MAG: GH92 family glycosyl hydrolase [Bacteroidales bacterium]|nr:GH92 family glycosyl hydrolase [Bacteroidales bacterium]
MKLRLPFILFLAFLVLPNDQAQPYYTFINPFIGSAGEGNVFVGASCPFGMAKPGPDCDMSSNSGYSADTAVPLYGFSQVHVSGTGGGPKYGNIQIMPFGGTFQSIHQESLRCMEKAQAGYYGVNLCKWNIKAELTCSPSVAFYRFVFSEPGNEGIKIDLGTFLGEESIPDAREAQQFVGSEIEIVSGNEVRGYSRIRGGWNNGRAYTVHFTAVFSKEFSQCGTWNSEAIFPSVRIQTDKGKKTGAFFLFDDMKEDTILVKIGISFISALKARDNISREVPHWDFQKLLSETQNRWEELVNRLEVNPEASKKMKTMFYTALYHTMLMPTDRTGENPLWVTDEPYYDDFYAIWDTYRTSHPLLTLISPSRQADMIRALLDIYKYDGYMPDARSGNCNGRTQGGSNAEIMIADAFVKNMKGIDYGLALKAMLKDATVPPGGNEEKEGRGGLVDYNRLGYVSDNFVRAGNRTLEYAYDDFCLAQVAKGLGRNGEYHRFMQQAENWKNLWRPVEDHGSTGFIMPKNAAGQWIDSVQCDVLEGQRNMVRYTPLSQEWPNCVCWWCGFFYEGNSWEYSFFVPHDVPGLIQMSGGSEAFMKRLDTFFNNGYYNVGNEPSFLAPCLYHWIGRPDMSSKHIYEIVNMNSSNDRDGIPGNDDSGAMSSRLAFHMMGLFPNAGQPYYLITSPFFRQCTIHLENGKDFVILADRFSSKNTYIKSAKLNGIPFEQAWINHNTIVNGGKLVLEMDDKPSGWGSLIPLPGMQYE